MTTDPGEPGEATARTRWQHPLLLGAIALAVAAAAVAAWFGVAWITAGNDETLERAKVRDDVSRIAEQAIETFNTLDYRQADAGLDSWLAVSTGPLHDEVVGRRESGKKAIASARNVTAAEVRALAVTDLDPYEGSATVVAAVLVKVTPEGKPTTEKWLPVQGALTRTPDGWKLSNLGQVNFSS